MLANPIGVSNNLSGNRTRRSQRAKTPVRLRSSAEEKFATSFANALNHATAVVAADPEKQFTRGSIAQRIRETYSRFRPEQRTPTQQRATARLSASASERQRNFGAYAKLGADAWSHASPGLDVEMKQLLKKAVYAFAHLEMRGITKPPIVPTMNAHKITIAIIASPATRPKCEAAIGPVVQTHKMNFIKSRRSLTPLEKPKALIAAANPIQLSTAVPIRLSKVMPTNQPAEKLFIMSKRCPIKGSEV